MSAESPLPGFLIIQICCLDWEWDTEAGEAQVWGLLVVLFQWMNKPVKEEHDGLKCFQCTGRQSNSCSRSVGRHWKCQQMLLDSQSYLFLVDDESLLNWGKQWKVFWTDGTAEKWGFMSWDEMSCGSLNSDLKKTEINGCPHRANTRVECRVQLPVPQE